VKKEYLQYTIEKLAENRDFIAWVNSGRQQEEWEKFLEANPEINRNVESARKIVELLRDRQDHIDEEDASKIWKSIEKFDLESGRQPHSFKTRSILRYAAIFIAFLMIGSVGVYWFLVRDNQFYTFSTKSITRSDSQSRLLLSDGTKVNLDKQNSKISLAEEQQIVINNNKIIDLTEEKISDQTKMNEIVIPFGKKSQLILEDGTKVWLNAGTRMAFPTKFSGKKREVFLEGEAYFEVAHNKNIPFIVNTNEIAVKVLGTRFNLSAYSSDQLTEAILLEGKVSVSEQSALKFMKAETYLAPNQKASFNKELKTISVSIEPDAELAIAWTEGWFKFSQQNLNGVLNKLQRYYNVTFVFDRNFSATDLISGKLDLKDSVEQVMLALSDVADLQYRINGDKIFIEKKIKRLNMMK
jgi:ferric-dicitrate binding protein FerR (iron transport regulator)